MNPPVPSASFRFEGLAIWHAARDFSLRVHRVTRALPRDEVYALTAQMNRAADAVSLLIAEGAGLGTRSLFRHRLSLAVGELFEAVAGSFLALDREYISAKQHAEIYRQGAILARQLHRFKATLR